MGFGFNFLVLFVIFPLTILLVLLWLFTRKRVFGSCLGALWGSLFFLMILPAITNPFFSKMQVDKNDIYGSYIIDRSKYSGTQSDWQYNSFRFEITRTNELIFHVTESKNILYSDTLKVEILDQYKNNRIRIIRSENTHHVIVSEPTMYRNVWSFYYVFNSPQFGNMFFTKGNWKPI